MFFKKRKHTREQGRTIDSQIIVVWGAGGNNTAAFSLKLAEELSQLARVILVELPCLGIPRLSFALEKWDHEQTIETVLTKYWFNGTIMGKGFYEHTPNLALLPISPFAQPDNPLVNQVGLEVLKIFPVILLIVFGKRVGKLSCYLSRTINSSFNLFCFTKCSTGFPTG